MPSLKRPGFPGGLSSWVPPRDPESLRAVECLLELHRGNVAEWLQGTVVNHQTRSRVPNSTSSRPLQGPRCRITSVLNNPITDSASALS